MVAVLPEEYSRCIHVTEKEQTIIQLDNSIVNKFHRQSQARVGSTHHRIGRGAVPYDHACSKNT